MTTSSGDTHRNYAEIAASPDAHARLHVPSSGFDSTTGSPRDGNWLTPSENVCSIAAKEVVRHLASTTATDQMIRAFALRSFNIA